MRTQNKIENVVMNEQKLTLRPSGVLLGVETHPESNSPEIRKVCDYVTICLCPTLDQQL